MTKLRQRIEKKHRTPDTVVEDLIEPVTEEQIAMVQETWGLVKGDIEKTGVEFYMRLFKVNPETLQMFSFRDIDKSSCDQMRADDRLKRQGLVTRTGNRGSIAPALKDLGERHAKYKVEEHHYGLFGVALLDTLDKDSRKKFTLDLKKHGFSFMELLRTRC